MQGNKVWGTEALLQQLPVMEGEPFMPFAAENALDKIRTLYWPLGYNDVGRTTRWRWTGASASSMSRSRSRKARRASSARFRSAARSGSTSSLVRRADSNSQPGQPLDLSALAKSRRNLYDTGAFSTVQINQGDRREENRRASADAGASGPQTSEQSAPAQPSEPIAQAENQPPNGQKPVPLNVVVREVQPLQLRYGASYDTERGIGGIFDISQHNWLGGARVIGLQSRYDRQLKDGRIYITQPALRYLPFQTTGTIYFREDLSPPSELTRAFNASRKGASIQQEVKLLDSYVWSWGYRWERARTLEPVAGVLIGDPHDRLAA